MTPPTFAVGDFVVPTKGIPNDGWYCAVCKVTKRWSHLCTTTYLVDNDKDTSEKCGEKAFVEEDLVTPEEFRRLWFLHNTIEKAVIVMTE